MEADSSDLSKCCGGLLQLNILMAANTPTTVAFGCRLTSVIDHNHFIALLRITPSSQMKEGEMAIIAAKGPGIMRGENETETLMKNCAILRVKRGERIATVKVFKQYLHFCKVNAEEADEIATFLCNEIKEAQSIIEDEDLLTERMDVLANERSHITPETKEEAKNYIRSRLVCSHDLEHEKIEATMTNHTIPLGTRIHTARLARLLRDEKGHRRWIVTFDNALSLAIRLVVPYSDSIKSGHTFTIQPTGNVLYSANDSSEEAETARKEVSEFLHERLHLVALS